MSPEMLNGDNYSYGIDYYSLGAVLYEMVTGLPPFYSTDQNEMFMGALYKQLHYPKQFISTKLADLLKLMLHKDPRRRVTKGQIGRIKNHPWCSDVDWQAVYEKRMVPPHIPSITESNFDPEYVRESSKLTTDPKNQQMQRDTDSR